MCHMKLYKEIKIVKIMQSELTTRMKENKPLNSTVQKSWVSWIQWKSSKSTEGSILQVTSDDELKLEIKRNK
jgi:hypothetical protein